MWSSRKGGRKKEREEEKGGGGFRFEQQQVPLELDKQTPGRCKCLFVL